MTINFRKYEITDRYKPNGVIVKSFRNGCVFGIRFSPDMTIDEVKESLKKEPSKRNEFRPFDESTGCFL